MGGPGRAASGFYGNMLRVQILGLGGDAGNGRAAFQVPVMHAKV